jgi:hypothetical protein
MTPETTYDGDLRLALELSPSSRALCANTAAFPLLENPFAAHLQALTTGGQQYKYFNIRALGEEKYSELIGQYHVPCHVQPKRLFFLLLLYSKLYLCCSYLKTKVALTMSCIAIADTKLQCVKSPSYATITLPHFVSAIES